MTKKLLGVFTTVVAALAVVGVAWASGDDSTSTSVTAATATSADVSTDASTPSTEATVPDSSSSTSVDTSTSTSADAATSTSVDDDPGSTTSTSIAATTSTSAAGTTSTSIDDDDDDDDTTTSTTIDDNDRSQVPDGVTSHVIPGVGTVTIEASAGQIFLASVSAPGWNVEHDRIESDRIELEFTNELDAEAEFEARINDGRVEVRIEVDLD